MGAVFGCSADGGVVGFDTIRPCLVDEADPDQGPGRGSVIVHVCMPLRSLYTDMSCECYGS